jgi:hypothetical protein
VTVIEGVDYSYDPPNPAGLVAAGKKFVVRYGALGNTAKYLTASEVSALRAAGLDIVANVEESKGGYRGTDAGVRWAIKGDEFFRAIGMPADRPIYFSIDWDASITDWLDIDAALRGSASVIGADRVGVYGGYDTITHCVETSIARWFWQTSSWSTWINPETQKQEVRWHPACHLQQYNHNITLAGGTVDLTRAVAVNFGQWGDLFVTQSVEYHDLAWISAKAYGTGRDGKAVRYIVIHYTAGAERNTSAEDGAVYDQKRTDGVSTHYFIDSNSVVQCVLTKNRANACYHKGNRLGIQYELCGTVQTRAQWLDSASLPTLRNAARQVARDCKKYSIPVRRLSVTETRAAWYDFPNGPKGIVGHVDVTNAYPEDGGDHTDPGTAFPWDIFLNMVKAELTGDDDVSKQDVLDGLAEFFAVAKQTDGTPTSRIGRDAFNQGIPNPFNGGNRSTAYTVLGDAAKGVRDAQTGITQILTQLTGGVKANVDVLALATALDELIPDVTVTPETVEQAFRRAFGNTQPQAVAGIAEAEQPTDGE